jgi:LytS/YehU family sensor histidine kinase
LQPLVENAVRHGVARHAGNGRIAIRASVDDHSLHIEISNAPATLLAPAGGGVGLTNTRERLQMLFHEAFALTIAPIDGGVVVSLQIPAARMGAEHAA